jgi:hypothetical protein
LPGGLPRFSALEYDGIKAIQGFGAIHPDGGQFYFILAKPIDVVRFFEHASLYETTPHFPQHLSQEGIAQPHIGQSILTQWCIPLGWLDGLEKEFAS